MQLIDNRWALCQTDAMKKIRITIAALLLSMSAGSIAFGDTAAPKSYQVAVIVFSQITTNALDSEQWPRIIPQQIPSQYTEMDTDASHYIPPANDDFTLSNELQSITKNPQYTILLQKEWLIPVKQFSNDVILHLYGGQAFDDSGKKLQVVTDESNPFLSASLWELNGTLNINMRRYFNLSFNLILAEPSNTIDQLSNNGYFKNNSDSYVYFKLNQTRRMRSNELNYIGHPLYGVLVKIMPSQEMPQQANDGQNPQNTQGQQNPQDQQNPQSQQNTPPSTQ
ncbi:MAG: peptidoglycan binding protein CsiV [Gammaproteobacteria bacterium]|nr:peptidoglycan binding protein CsiV [Gammaproteobacteria bacterium]